MPGDVTAPVLYWATFNTNFDLSLGPGTINFSASAKDDLSGVFRIDFSFKRVKDQFYLDSYSFDLKGIPDSSENVEISVSREVNQFLARGIYALAAIRLDDELGNVRIILPEEALALGIPAQIVIHDGSVSVANPTLGDDSVIGTAFQDFIAGYSGNDFLSGGGGIDSIEGGLGNDTLMGGEGADLLLGGAGFDTASWRTETGRVSLNLSDQSRNGGSSKGDMIYAVEAFDLTEFNDILVGYNSAVRIHGNKGSDRLTGSSKSDTISGGSGNDTLTGGLGRDSFVFEQKDTSTSRKSADYISDFAGARGDRIDLKLIDANFAKAGNQAFSFIGTKGFTKAGQVRYEKTSKETYVLFSTDADKAAEGIIRLKGMTDLQKSWFIL